MSVQNHKKKLTVISGVPVALIISFMLFFSFYTINEGERGILLRNGKIVKVAEPGLGFKWPFVESINKISVRNNLASYKKLQAYSRDQQPAEMSVSLNFHIPPSEVEKVYSGYGSLERMVDRLVSRQAQTQLENVFGQYTAIRAVQERSKLVADLQFALRNSINGPLVIDSVQIENIDFSDAYEKSIEDRMKAEVAIATRRQNLETEKIQAEIAVTQAEAAARSKIASAEAEAKAIRLKGAAEAEAIKLRGEALRNNPSLVALTTAERWNGILPTTMIPGGGVPFLVTNQEK